MNLNIERGENIAANLLGGIILLALTPGFAQSFVELAVIGGRQNAALAGVYLGLILAGVAMLALAYKGWTER